MSRGGAGAGAARWAALCALAVGAPAYGQDAASAARIAELERKLDQSLQLIEALSDKVKRLEQRAAPEPRPQISAQPTHAAPLQPVEQAATPSPAAHAMPPAPLGSGLHAFPDNGTPLKGFAQVGYAHSGRSNPLESTQKGFGVAGVDLYLTPQLGDRVKTLIELIFEMEPDGEILTDLERAQIGYTFSDAAMLWAGRFHIPQGYWNTAYHHGAQLQTSILRPRFLEFEEAAGAVPAHMVGLWLTGQTHAGSGKLGYDLYLGNGPRIRIDAGKPGSVGTLDPNSHADDNHQATVGGRVQYAFAGALDGWIVGAHGLRGDVRDDTPAATRTRLQYLGPFAAFESETWEVLGELYRFRNRDLSSGSGTRSSSAGYVQAGRSVGAWTPYLRLERASFDQSDPYFARLEGGRSYRRGALGLRYDLEPKAALKLELNRTRVEAIETGVPGVTVDDRYGEMRMEYSVRF